MKQRDTSSRNRLTHIAVAPVMGLLVCGAAAAAPVKIGVLETLSGPQASSGQAYRTAVRYEEEGRAAAQVLCCVRLAVCLAKEVGALLE